jgi:hypothetical protein
MDLEKIAPIIEKIMKDTLEQKRYPFGFAKFKGVGNKVASGKLRDSISVKVVKVNEGESIIQVLTAEYAQWVQSGRLPGKKGIPVDALEKWIKERGLTGRDKKGRFIKRRSFAFAIQSNIKKFGIRPSNFLDVALEMIANDPKIMDLIEDGAYEELLNLIEGI